MIEVLKEEINKPSKEIQENKNKELKGLNKTVKDLYMETESRKEIQTEETSEIKM